MVTKFQDVASIAELVFIEPSLADQAAASETKFQDIAHLAGLIFIKRGFVDKATASTDAIRAECRFGDLTDDQLATFEACIRHPKLREVINQWWTTYDAARAAGEIPGVQGFWAP